METRRDEMGGEEMRPLFGLWSYLEAVSSQFQAPSILTLGRRVKVGRDLT